MLTVLLPIKNEAIQIAINAGIDMAMEPYDLNFCTLLKDWLKKTKVPMSRIDDAVRRVLRLKYRLGLFEQPNTPTQEYPLFGSKEHAELALRAAEESEILLKNPKQYSSVGIKARNCWLPVRMPTLCAV